jgi:hypothetical protein
MKQGGVCVKGQKGARGIPRRRLGRCDLPATADDAGAMRIAPGNRTRIPHKKVRAYVPLKDSAHAFSHPSLGSSVCRPHRSGRRATGRQVRS